MFNSNPAFSLSQEFKPSEMQDKENVQPKSSKQTPFLNNLFSKSEEINTMSTEMSNLPKSFENREQVRHKVYAYGGSQNSHSQSQLSHKNSGNQNIQPFVVDGAKASARVKGAAVKFDVKTPYNEMKENIACLEKVNSFQKNFYAECTQEIEKLNGEISTKKSIIEETNKKINDVSEEMQQSALEFEKEYQDLLEEMKKLETECEELRNLNSIEDNRYQEALKAVEASHQDLNSKIAEDNDLKKQITEQEADIAEKEMYFKQIKDSLSHYQKLQGDLESDLRDIFEKKKYLNNELQELKGNIRVYGRIRPYLESDPQDEIANEMLKIKSCTSLEFTVPQSYLKSDNNIKEYKFNFEHIFDNEAKQIDIFNELSQLIQSALDGYNVCIFAYGQTGSGKTYTMEGNTEDPEAQGIILRSVGLIFEQINYMKNFGWEYNVYVSFQEIYNEQARDLITYTPDSKAEISSVEISDEKEFYPLLKKATENRAVAETQCNEHSSRSHSIFQLKLRGRNEAAKQESNGTLNLIDLAGSERLAVSKAEGERLKETQSINKSLTSLSDVITALANKDKHIPYRNSKLTFVLQPYLGGDSKTLMLVNLSPLLSNFHQTLCTLRFAAKVKSCEVGTAKKQIKNI